MSPLAKPKVGIIGAGKVGKALSWALSTKGYKYLATSSRSMSSAKTLAEKVPGCKVFADPQQVVDSCDLVFITTPDDIISHVVGTLTWGRPTSVVHCSGVYSLDILKAAAIGATSVGSLHPFQTFAAINNRAEASTRCEGVVFAIDGDPHLSSTLENMVWNLKGTTIRIPPQFRALYHSSAVLSCAHLTSVISAAIRIWEYIGLPRKKAEAAVLNMAKSTMENIMTAGIGTSLTGPIARGDIGTLEKHLAALKQSTPSILKMYCLLGLTLLSEVRCNLKHSTAMEIQLLLEHHVSKNDMAQEC